MPYFLILTNYFFCLSFTLTVGLEKVKPFTERLIQPFLSDTAVVATLDSPDPPTTDTDALIGAFENL